MARESLPGIRREVGDASSVAVHTRATTLRVIIHGPRILARHPSERARSNDETRPIDRLRSSRRRDSTWSAGSGARNHARHTRLATPSRASRGPRPRGSDSRRRGNSRVIRRAKTSHSSAPGKKGTAYFRTTEPRREVWRYSPFSTEHLGRLRYLSSCRPNAAKVLDGLDRPSSSDQIALTCKKNRLLFLT